MKRNILITYIFVFLLLVLNLDAKTFRDAGLYGSLSYTYIEDIYISSNSENAQEQYVQEYKLGYKGNIYNPKLIDYRLETIFRYEDIINRYQSFDSESKINSQDYRVDISFIKNTRTPFRIYYKTVDRPTSYIYGNTISKYTQDQESKGFSGSIDFSLFRLLYSGKYEDDIFDRDSTVQHRKSENHEASVSKSDKNYNFNLTYSHLNQSTQSDILNVSSKTIYEEYDRANLTYMWKISDKLKLNSNISYFNSKYLLSESLAGNAQLVWNPKSDYSGTISVNSTLINQSRNVTDEFGITTQEDEDTMGTYGASQSFNYRITKNLTFTEAISYLSYESASSTGENSSINLGLNYGLKLSDLTRLSMSGGVSQRESTLTTISILDQNESTTDEQSTAYTLQAGITKQFESVESRLNVIFKYSGTQSSNDRTNDSTMLRVTLNSKFWTVVKNNISLNYSMDNSNYTSSIDGDSTETSVSRLSASDNLTVSSRLGIKGNISSTLGVSYSMINNNDSVITRVIPKLNLAVNYRFFQRIMYQLSIGMYQDLSYDFLNYYADTSVSYAIGKTSMSINYSYNMTGLDNGVDITTLEKSKFTAKVVRKF